jgi:hypothetical protein
MSSDSRGCHPLQVRLRESHWTGFFPLRSDKVVHNRIKTYIRPDIEKKYRMSADYELIILLTGRRMQKVTIPVRSFCKSRGKRWCLESGNKSIFSVFACTG